MICQFREQPSFEPDHSGYINGALSLYQDDDSEAQHVTNPDPVLSNKANNYDNGSVTNW
ncbi:hypothetical protein MHO82_01505 [Vibrio sp. Of7-15]|uniref:hypothetical protein n=1 Tax=Vibrio sp. Of7-15 TaxID=2724879 RepID=UPI001EF278E3|nr:hypothetical protein [Vibrio sp. Of7-15]MCG7495537.1 hypothetical protein [Vibrio sp. Of7-15]